MKRYDGIDEWTVLAARLRSLNPQRAADLLEQLRLVVMAEARLASYEREPSALATVLERWRR